MLALKKNTLLIRIKSFYLGNLRSLIKLVFKEVWMIILLLLNLLENIHIQKYRSLIKEFEKQFLYNILKLSY